MAVSEWKIEGFLGKYPKEGTSKTGHPWMRQSVAVMDGKDKEDETKNKWINVGFFVPKDDIPRFKALAPGTKIGLKGKPEANAYINKDGELISSLNIKLAWEDSWWVIKETQPELPVEPEYDPGEEPF